MNSLALRKWIFTLALAGMTILGLSASTFPASSSTHASPHGGVTVTPAVKHDVSQPLRTITPVHTPTKGNDEDLKLPAIPQGKPDGIADHLQTSTTASHMPSLSNSFAGVGDGFTGPQGTFTVPGAPSDSNGAVGPQDFVEIVNTDFAIFNKDSSRGTVGSVRYGPVQINTLWSGFGGNCEADNDGDPVVVYDSIANRWVISQFAIEQLPNSGFFECVAVSTGSDPTGSYNRYAFSYANFPDYPKFGLWPDAYYVSYNMFDPTGTNFVGAQVCALDRASMLTGSNANQQCTALDPNSFGMLPSTLDGSTLPPTGSPNYVMELETTSSLALWQFHVDWTTPANSTFTGPTSIPVAPFTPACGGGTCIPQAGTTQQLDSLGDRLMYQLAYRNFGSYESLVVDHAVDAGNSVGMRWYEIRSPGSTPTVFQSGTYAPDSNYRWMGSIAEDHSGDMAMGFSISSSSMNPGISYTGRLVGDPLGSMAQGEASVLVGGGSQTGARSLSRWGDYTSMGVDPTDDCTFWYTDQYIPSNGIFNWETQIASFKFPSCSSGPDFSIKANPTSLFIAPGSSDTSTINTAVTSGSAGTVNLTTSVSPAGPTASLNPTSVTAGSSSTLTVNVGSGVPIGTYTVTVTGAEGSATHSTSVQVVVTKVSKTWYFAEGYTGPGFTEWLTIANPFSVTANVTVTYYRQGTTAITKQYQVSNNSRYTLEVNNEAGSNQQVSMTVNSDVPIVAERPMYFDYNSQAGPTIPGGSDVLGATSLAKQFDFGYLDTTSGHETWLTILNQNSQTMNVTINYYPAAGGSPITKTHQVPANTRGTVFVNGDVSAGSYSALVSLDQPGLVERPMYLIDGQTHYTGAADVVGVATPSADWDFAEGYTSNTFEERYILSNPNPSATTATVTFFLSGGATKTATVNIPAGGQQVVDANNVLGSGGVNNSAHVHAGQLILAERFISFSYTGPVGNSSSSAIPGASDVLGAPSPSTTFYFAEGYTGGAFGEYLTIENPSTSVAHVTVTYLPANGQAPTVVTYSVPASSRYTVFTNGVLGNQSFSMVVTSDVAIVAERPMYFNYYGITGGSDVVGYAP